MNRASRPPLPGRTVPTERTRAMIDSDDLDARRTPQPLKDLARLDLSTMGVTELENYISALEAEIARARIAIAGKQTHRSAAEALFRRG